nr:uncharacterized protein LOC105476452 [Macaca nemestrina]
MSQLGHKGQPSRVHLPASVPPGPGPGSTPLSRPLAAWAVAQRGQTPPGPCARRSFNRRALSALKDPMQRAHLLQDKRAKKSEELKAHKKFQIKMQDAEESITFIECLLNARNEACRARALPLVMFVIA